MFRHQGKRRRAVHDLKLATLLSFVAGVVNVTGFLALGVLTTNVTGHFAYFADGLVKARGLATWIFPAYVLSFFAGAFAASFLMEITKREWPRYTNATSVFAEIFLLAGIALWASTGVAGKEQLIGCALLFTMGLQNALVTRVSNSVVRTTHLTGMFTDLGIELSQWCFYPDLQTRRRLSVSVRLRLVIIGSFFLGCVIGGVGYLFAGVAILWAVAALLLTGFMYQDIRYRYLRLKRGATVQ